MFGHIDFKSGEVRYCSDCMEKEDILQVEYPNNYILDLGWYGEKNGFILYIIRDFEWSVPVVKYTSNSCYGKLWITEEITE